MCVIKNVLSFLLVVIVKMSNAQRTITPDSVGAQMHFLRRLKKISGGVTHMTATQEITMCVSHLEGNTVHYVNY